MVGFIGLTDPDRQLDGIQGTSSLAEQRHASGEANLAAFARDDDRRRDR
jgi:hypothetical protein